MLNILDRIPQLPLGPWVDNLIAYTQRHWSASTQAFSDNLEGIIKGMQGYLMAIPPEIFILLVALLAWRLAGKRMAIFSIVGLVFVYNINLWSATMATIAMVLAAVGLCIFIGVPLGILAAKNSVVHRLVTPLLDFMQTLPAFVYLLPAIPFFGLGVVPGVLTTIVFAMPPVIRLTDLGLKQVPEELIELGRSFGSTFFEMLFKIELPLARSTILAGINQCIMLSLSMVVIAAMIGAQGLGGVVWRAIQTLRFGMGFEAGVAIVVIAVILDRITQSLGRTKEERGDL